MQLTNQHKALLITFLISGTVLLFVFNLSLKNYDEVVAESFYELEPEKPLTEEEKKIKEAIEKLAKAETNNAFNETEKNKHFAQAYKQIAPPEDYVPKTSEENTGEDNDANSLGETKALKPAVNKEALSSYNKVNNLLKQQQENAGINTKSTVSFSLVNRKKVYIPIPVYLCEENGKIVVTITVNAIGDVIDVYANNASTSKNACLIEHALEYAKSSKFSTDASKKTQIGTITFSFIGKH